MKVKLRQLEILRDNDFTIKLLLFFILFTFYFSAFTLAATWEMVTPQILENLKKTVKNQPLNANAHFNLAIAYAKTAYMEKSWAEFKKTHDLSPNFYMQQVNYYHKKVVKNSFDINARFCLTFGYYFTQRRKLAILEHEKILNIEPKFIWSYNYLGYLLKEDGQLNKSMEILEKGIKLDSNNAMTHFFLGQTYYSLKKFDDALVEISLAMKLKKDNPF